MDIVYDENGTKLSWPIRQSAIYDENKIGQQCDQLYKCGIYRK